MVDMNPVKLGASIETNRNTLCIPIADLTKAIGVKPIVYKPDEMLFMLIQ
jgi:hypothetical protein